MFQNIVTMTHQILKHHLFPGATVLDGTVGMGQDTLFLAECVGQNGKVYGFDIQEIAIKTTKNKLREKKCDQQVTLIHDSHAHIDQYLPDEACLDAAIFNLGYLPKGDKSIITNAQTTLPAIEKTIAALKPTGILLIASYIGHNGGFAEYERLQTFLKKYEQKKFHIGEFQFINQKNNPPRLFIIERR